MTGVQTCALPILQQEPGVAEREQALVRRSAEERAERLAAARKRVELFASPTAARPRLELFGANAGSAAAGTAGTSGTRSRIELFGSSPRPINSNNARSTEEA